MRKHAIPAVVCLPLVLALTACDVKVGGDGDLSFDVTHGRANDEWTRSYTLQKGARLEIASAGGPVYVTAGGPQVTVKIVRQGQAASDDAAQQVLKDETISEQVTPERVRVETKRPGNNTGAFGRRRVSTEWHVSIPAGLNVFVKGENADVTLTNVEGTFVLENTNGGFRSVGTSGSITASTVNGAIDLDFQQLTGDVKATTVNGMVRVGVPTGVNATLDARTVNGGVAVEDDLGFMPTERERQRVTGQFGKGGPAITLHTTNGPVRVRQGGVHMGGRRGGQPVVVERQLQER